MIESLYIHIPFCVQKCLYCDFNSYVNSDLQDNYINALIKEIDMIKQDRFKTIFIGGGTPTILSLDNLMKLLNVLNKFTAEEYTLESNPGTLTVEKLKVMKYYGANRLSIGLQAWQNELLNKLGRIHSNEEFLDSFENARNCGFQNINVDLMFSIPGQKTLDLITTLNNVTALNPEHISCYSLIIEEGTPFFQMYSDGRLDIVNEEIEREMYYSAAGKLISSGYKHYEISNFAKPGFECRHNITYWHDEEYYGVGAGAHSYIGKTRCSNYREIEGYIKNMNLNNPVETINHLTQSDELSEFMFLGLRMIDGISRVRFKEKFGSDLDTYYNNEIKDLVNCGLLQDSGEYIKLTSRGIDISNQVFLRFLK